MTQLLQREIIYYQEQQIVQKRAQKVKVWFNPKKNNQNLKE